MPYQFSVADLCRTFLEPDFQDVRIVEVSNSEELFRGTAADAANSKYKSFEVESIDTLFDATQTLTINICSD